MLWEITDKADRAARWLVDDGKGSVRGPHYSRQTPGAPLFTRPGQNLVLVDASESAVWVTQRPKPGAATRTDGLDAWECTLFRNCAPDRLLSSELVREATLATWAIWIGALGYDPPRDGLITFVKPNAIQSRNPGYCYKVAGWRTDGRSSDGKPRLRAPGPPADLPDWRAWKFHRARGGALRDMLEPTAPGQADMLALFAL